MRPERAIARHAEAVGAGRIVLADPRASGLGGARCGGCGGARRRRWWTGSLSSGGSLAGLEAASAGRVARLEPFDDGSYRWRWEHGNDLRSPLRPLAQATVELLADGPLDRLKRCGGCRWLFLDASKNRSRHWCSMEVCGTHAKMRRYVERRRQAGRAAGRFTAP